MRAPVDAGGSVPLAGSVGCRSGVPRGGKVFSRGEYTRGRCASHGESQCEWTLAGDLGGDAERPLMAAGHQSRPMVADPPLLVTRVQAEGRLRSERRYPAAPRFGTLTGAGTSIKRKVVDRSLP